MYVSWCLTNKESENCSVLGAPAPISICSTLLWATPMFEVYACIACHCISISVASDLTDHMTSIYLQIRAVSLFCQFSAIVHSHVLFLVILSRQMKNLICQLINYPVLTKTIESDTNPSLTLKNPSPKRISAFHIDLYNTFILWSMQKLIPKSIMSMHFLLLELCVDSLEKTTLNQPQIMEEKRVPAVGLEPSTVCILSWHVNQ